MCVECMLNVAWVVLVEALDFPKSLIQHSLRRHQLVILHVRIVVMIIRIRRNPNSTSEVCSGKCDGQSREGSRCEFDENDKRKHIVLAF
jgi:hypothetical protein